MNGTNTNFSPNWVSGNQCFQNHPNWEGSELTRRFRIEPARMKLILAFIAAIRGSLKRFFIEILFLWKYKMQQDLNQLLNGGRLTLKFSKISKLHWINSGDDDYTYDDISIDDLMSMGDPLSKWGQTQAGFKLFLHLYIIKAIQVHWIS